MHVAFISSTSIVGFVLFHPHLRLIGTLIYMSPCGPILLGIDSNASSSISSTSKKETPSHMEALFSIILRLVGLSDERAATLPRASKRS